MEINCAFSQDSVDNVTTTEHSCAAPHTDVVGDAQIFVQVVTNLDSHMSSSLHSFICFPLTESSYQKGTYLFWDERWEKY